MSSRSPPTRWRTSSTTVVRGFHHLAGQGRPGRRVARPDAQRRAAALDGWRDRRLRLLRGRCWLTPRTARAPHGGHGHALQLRHDRPTQGVLPTIPETPLEVGTGVAGLLALSLSTRSRGISRRRCLPRRPGRFTMGTHVTGGTVVVMERFDPVDYLRLTKSTASRSPGRSHDVRSDAQARRGNPQHHDLLAQRLRARSGACPVEVKRKMIDWWGLVIHEYYAGTEGNGFVYCNSEQWLAHPGTVGSAVPRDTSSERTAKRCPSAKGTITSSPRPNSNTTAIRRRRRATPRQRLVDPRRRRQGR